MFALQIDWKWMMRRSRYTRSRLVAIALMVMLTALLAAAPAGAERRATLKERRAIGGIAKNTRCSHVSISTVSERWAVLYLTNARGCPGGDGFSTFQKTNGRWRHVLDGPNENLDCNGETYAPRIPVRVQADFGICLY